VYAGHLLSLGFVAQAPGYLVKPGPLSIIETRSMRAELALFGVPGLRRLSGLGCGFARAFL
jgi:hypothetical protein